MEAIEFRYVFKDNDQAAHEVRSVRKDKNDEGLHGTDICEMFMDFMRSVGFSEQNVIDYFNN